jgi:hypothetical protein
MKMWGRRVERTELRVESRELRVEIRNGEVMKLKIQFTYCTTTTSFFIGIAGCLVGVRAVARVLCRHTGGYGGEGEGGERFHCLGSEGVMGERNTMVSVETQCGKTQTKVEDVRVA